LAIIADVNEAADDAHDLTSIFATATEWSARPRAETEAASALESLVERAELHHDGIRLLIRLPLDRSGKPAATAPTHLLLARQIPLLVRRRGIEMRLVIGKGVRRQLFLPIALTHEFCYRCATGCLT
jgi:hypothetical protein